MGISSYVKLLAVVAVSAMVSFSLQGCGAVQCSVNLTTRLHPILKEAAKKGASAVKEHAKGAADAVAEKATDAHDHVKKKVEEAHDHVKKKVEEAKAEEKRRRLAEDANATAAPAPAPKIAKDVKECMETGLCAKNENCSKAPKDCQIGACEAVSAFKDDSTGCKALHPEGTCSVAEGLLKATGVKPCGCEEMLATLVSASAPAEKKKTLRLFNANFPEMLKVNGGVMPLAASAMVAAMAVLGVACAAIRIRRSSTVEESETAELLEAPE